MSLPALASIILYFNLISFGNGPIMIPLLEKRLVDQAGVLSLEVLALNECTTYKHLRSGTP